MTVLNPYLNFRGQAREAMEFYASVLGGTPTFSTFGEFGMNQDPAEADQVMHSMLQTPGGMTLMAADVPAQMEYQPGTNVHISLSGDDVDELRGYFDGLAAGGTVVEPFVAAPWGDTFGMLIDPFGIRWLVNAAGQPA
ncbi:VOC family protein [Ruania alkalisoli]|uniref:VOC family protein n=1 Tax=Ruania alkalisoli TaxID=2779775 RepID=A0A7M1STV9_9MICO|nr:MULTISPECIES: VOC family protein [Ruania]QOR70384.1 VOC family protein [Ruania alkalisoli]